MGFDFTALGRPLVVDPGRYCYRSDDDRRTFKTVAYHNTLMIDGADPYPYLASGRSGRPKDGGIRWVREQDGLLAGRGRAHQDVARPSTRLLLEDAAPPTDTTRLYATVIVPSRAASPAPALADLQIGQDGERIHCGFTLDGHPYR